MVGAYFGAKETASIRTDQLLTAAFYPQGMDAGVHLYEVYMLAFDELGLLGQ